MSYDFASCLKRARQLQATGASDEELLRFLRMEGASMMESVKLIRQIKVTSLREAQDIVHFSDTWEDCRESHERLQETFTEALNKLAQETADGEDKG